ncbi:MAG: NADH dehydrogenase ubiquinone Fe-S protein 4 [Rickettsiales bacterium]
MKAIIYKEQNRITQSGKGSLDKWNLEFRKEQNITDPILESSGSINTKDQIKISFDSREEAVRYAKENSIYYEVIKIKPVIFKSKSYSQNFRNR